MINDNVLLVSRRDAAGAIGISLRKLDALTASGEILVRRIGRRCLILRRSLENFVNRPVGGGSKQGRNTLSGARDFVKTKSRG